MMKIRFYILRIISKSKVHLISLFLLMIIIGVSACIPRGTSVTKVTSMPVVSTSTSIIPSSVVTATPTAILSNIQDKQYPNKILFSLGGIATNGCLTKNRAEIWISEYPFNTMHPLVQDPNTDYLYPNWSPNRKWVAYVASSPFEAVDPSNSPSKTGTDSIWIMRDDGSNKRKVSEDIPSILIHSSVDNSCFKQSGISLPLAWSRDGQYIAFAQTTWDKNISKLVYNYYVVDIASGNTQFLLSQDLGVSPVWIIDDAVVISGRGLINIIRGLGTNELKTIEISYPTNIPLESESFVSAMINNKDLTVSFRLGSTLISPIPKKVSVWELNPISREWKQVTTIEKQTWGIPNIGNKGVTLCDENVITILDPNSWEPINQITSGELNTDWINCGMLKTVQQHTGNDLLVLLVNLSGGLEIRAITLEFQKKEIKVLVDSSVFSRLPAGTQILDFSFITDSQ